MASVCDVQINLGESEALKLLEELILVFAILQLVVCGQSGHLLLLPVGGKALDGLRLLVGPGAGTELGTSGTVGSRHLGVCSFVTALGTAHGISLAFSSQVQQEVS